MWISGRGDFLEASAPVLRSDSACRHNSSRKSIDGVRLACLLHRGKFAAQGALVDLLTGLIDTGQGGGGGVLILFLVKQQWHDGTDVSCVVCFPCPLRPHREDNTTNFLAPTMVLVLSMQPLAQYSAPLKKPPFRPELKCLFFCEAGCLLHKFKSNENDVLTFRANAAKTNVSTPSFVSAVAYLNIAKQKTVARTHNIHFSSF